MDMSFKIAILSDPHFHDYKRHSHLVGGVNSRLLDVCQAVKDCFAIAEEAGCKTLLVAGDVFHVRGSVKTVVMDHALEVFSSALKKHGLTTYIIPGNHDMDDRLGERHALSALGYVPGVNVLGFGTYNVEGLSLGAIPYKPTTDEFFRAYDEIMRDKPEALMIHQGIDEVRPAVTIPETGISVVSFNCKVVAGHYHKPMCFENVLSVGSPLQHNFGDEGQDRGCWIFDGNKYTFHKVKSPKFITVNIEDLKDTDVEGKIIRVITDDERRIPDSSAITKGAYSCIMEVEKKAPTVRPQRIEIASPIEMLGQYLDATNIYKNKDALMKKAVEVFL